MERYEVYGYYTDEPQVVVDIVDAASDEEAERLITEARGGEHSGYTCDGASTLKANLELIQQALQQSPEEIAKAVDALRRQYCEENE